MQYDLTCAVCVSTQMYCSETPLQAFFDPSSFFSSLSSTLFATFLKNTVIVRTYAVVK